MGIMMERGRSGGCSITRTEHVFTHTQNLNSMNPYWDFWPLFLFYEKEVCQKFILICAAR